ncbi:MAG TPA: hypothetical protein VHL34_05440 [Rhizomicrobium sp.]|jgi:hypothetical protein|nr:hypothetical protein [Rhizomicrobium sp.]
MSDLDLLLSAPLEDAVDMGFSAHVMMKVADMRLRQAKIEAALSLAGVVLLFMIAALTPIGPALGKVGVVLAGTPAIWLGAILLVLSSVVYVRVRAA